MRIELTLRPETEEDYAFFCDEEGNALICKEWADANGLAGATRIAVTVSAKDNGGLKVGVVDKGVDFRPDVFVGDDSEEKVDLSGDASDAVEAYCRENCTDTFWVRFEVLS